MSNRSKIFLAIISAICATILPYLACDFFDAPVAHGIISWDVLFIIMAMSISQKKSPWCIPFIISAIVFALVNNDISSYIFSGISLALLFGLIYLPKKKTLVIITFLALALISLVCDAAIFFYDSYSLHISDVWGLAVFFWWGPIAFILVPAIAVALPFLLAKRILFGKDKLQLTYLQAFLILAIAFGTNCGINALQNRQPIIQAPVKTLLWQRTLRGHESKCSILQENTKRDFLQWSDSLALFETNRPTLMVLVESWGVNKSSEYTSLLLKPFENIHTFSGILKRSAGTTHMSEMEDFGTLDDKEALALPQKFREKNFQTWYVHGYNGSFTNRDTEYAKFGFDSLLFKKDFVERGFETCKYGFDGICDTTMANIVDNLMSDSIPKFIYWTTLDPHPPIEKVTLDSFAPECKMFNLEGTWCTYLTLQYNALIKLVQIAQKHPEYRIIIRGDHRPMGSAEQGFVSSFYYRYVPIVILN